MKTTVEVSDYLYRRAKAEAALQGRKLKDLVEEGLRLVLEAPVVASYLLSMAATRTSDVAGDRHIRSVTLKNAQGDETGDDIIFEIELFHETPLDSPRVAICINSPSGDRIATIHTNIQQNERWSIRGTRKIRAIWKRNPLAASEYGVDVRFWGHDAEIVVSPTARPSTSCRERCMERAYCPTPSSKATSCRTHTGKSNDCASLGIRQTEARRRQIENLVEAGAFRPAGS
jgi:hypothetical protein